MSAARTSEAKEKKDSSFLRKRRKKLLSIGAVAHSGSSKLGHRIKQIKVFLLLFLQKKKTLPALTA
jgi:hypothetical protein